MRRTTHLTPLPILLSGPCHHWVPQVMLILLLCLCLFFLFFFFPYLLPAHRRSPRPPWLFLLPLFPFSPLPRWALLARGAESAVCGRNRSSPCRSREACRRVDLELAHVTATELEQGGIGLAHGARSTATGGPSWGSPAPCQSHGAHRWEIRPRCSCGARRGGEGRARVWGQRIGGGAGGREAH